MTDRYPLAAPLVPRRSEELLKDLKTVGQDTPINNLTRFHLTGDPGWRQEAPFSDDVNQENFGGHEYGREDHVSSVAKQTNPKDAVGIKKVPISCVPMGVMMELGVAMMEGARKYGRHNYREAGVRASVYVDAACGRHMPLWWDFGQDIDPDSGLSHVTKAIASLTVLRDGMMMKNWIDDRPPPLPIELYFELQKAVEGIFQKYPTSVPAFVNPLSRK